METVFQLSGLIAPFPVFGDFLAAFTHAQQDSNAVASLLHGIVFGSLAFSGFFVVVGVLLPPVSIALIYLLAGLAAVAANATAFYHTGAIAL